MVSQATAWHFCTFEHLSERPIALLRKTACTSLETESFDNAPAKGFQAISLLFPLRLRFMYIQEYSKNFKHIKIQW